MPGAADASPPRSLPPSVPPHPAGFPRLLPGRGLLRGPRRPSSLTPVVFSSRLTSIYENELRFLFSDLSTCGSFSIDSGGFQVYNYLYARVFFFVFSSFSVLSRSSVPTSFISQSGRLRPREGPPIRRQRGRAPGS